jgi:hypothetical protein
MNTDWNLFRSKIDMITLDTADDAINIADTLYNTMVHTDSNIIPVGCGQTLGNATNPWESLFTSTIITGSNPLSIENDLDVIGNADIGNQLNVVGNAIFLDNMIIDHNLTVNNGNFNLTKGNTTMTNGNISMTKGNFSMTNGNISMTKGGFTVTEGNITMTNGDLTLALGDLNMICGILTSNGGIIVSNGGINILHGGMNIVGGVDMKNSLTVNNSIELTGNFNVSGQTRGGLYPITSISTADYTLPTNILSLSDNMFFMSDNTIDYNITLPSLPNDYNAWGAHFTIGTYKQASSDQKYYKILTQGDTPIFGMIAGSVVSGGPNANLYSENGFQITYPDRGESHELIWTPGGYFLRGIVGNAQKITIL